MGKLVIGPKSDEIEVRVDGRGRISFRGAQAGGGWEQGMNLSDFLVRLGISEELAQFVQHQARIEAEVARKELFCE